MTCPYLTVKSKGEDHEEKQKGDNWRPRIGQLGNTLGIGHKCKSGSLQRERTSVFYLYAVQDY